MSKKFRIVTNGKNFKVQYKIFLFWKDYTYGVAEGGGSYLIYEPTAQKALERLIEAETPELAIKEAKWVPLQTTFYLQG